MLHSLPKISPINAVAPESRPSRTNVYLTRQHQIEFQLARGENRITKYFLCGTSSREPSSWQNPIKAHEFRARASFLTLEMTSALARQRQLWDFQIQAREFHDLEEIVGCRYVYVMQAHGQRESERLASLSNQTRLILQHAVAAKIFPDDLIKSGFVTEGVARKRG